MTNGNAHEAGVRGIALLAVLVALTVLLLLSLPLAVSMSRGADVAAHSIDAEQVDQLSAGLRDDMLSTASLGHPTFDPTPTYDTRDEFPDGPPATFGALQLDGRARYGGEVVDLQRFLPLDAASPLMFANVLGATARLRTDLTVDASAVQVDDATNLPEQGCVWIDHELIRYGKKQGNDLLDLQRSVGTEQGFLRQQDHPTVAETALVLDYRCVLAATWAFDGRCNGSRKERKPLRDPRELAEVALAGFGAFTGPELDRFAEAFRADGQLVAAPTFGRPERLFDDMTAGLSRTLRVKGALSLGPGSTVRLRNLKTGAFEFGLVMATAAESDVVRELLLPSEFRLDLLLPVLQDFKAVESVVEPLLPPPLNCNTADAKVLAAVFANLRRGMRVRVHDADGRKRIPPQVPFSWSEARELADQIVALRAGTGADAGPFAGWKEIAERLFKPRFHDAANDDARSRLVDLYRALQTGRDSKIEMGTLPLCFQSGPVVGYRAACSLQRSRVAPGIAAREERTGVAIALPGLPLMQPWQTQEQFEEAFRQDQRAPWWLTVPVNTSSTGTGEAGNEPTSRATAHVVGMAWPDLGLGAPRFPSRDKAEAAFQPAPASVPQGRSGQLTVAAKQVISGHESFGTTIDPRGRDTAHEGPFLCKNTGPRDFSAPPPPPRTHELSFPFTTRGGFAGRFATGFWVEPESLTTSTLFDYAGTDGNKERNRMSLSVVDGELVFEVIDEAGFDPDPSQSLSGISRAAAHWHLPLAEYGLPAHTAMHVSVGANSNHPNDLAVFVDGIARGKSRYRTYLTASVPVYDPAINTGSGPVQTRPNDSRYVTLQVDDASDFPSAGVLRVGLELFEYTKKSGNTFLCRINDSFGGRAARMSAREMRPDIQLGPNGDPTVDYNTLGQQNQQLEAFPEHPVGTEVELYGYSVAPSYDTPVLVGSTKLDGTLGAFAIARAYVTNGRPITQPTTPPRTLGTGLDTNYTGDIELADPPKAGGVMPLVPPAPPVAPQEILEAFPAGGGYALLVQRQFHANGALGEVGTAIIGGVEVIRYGQRTGTKLTGIQRAQRLPGDDSQVARTFYDGTAHQFVTDWELPFQPIGAPRPLSFDEFPNLLTYVVPISFPVQNSDVITDPSVAGYSEWLQLYDKSKPEDTEWVRYDQLIGKQVVRTNRARWDQLRFRLTEQVTTDVIQVGRGGSNNFSARLVTDPAQIWGRVTATSGYIGYVPQLESTYPEIAVARAALAFRGDPLTGTSSHPQRSSTVLPVFRLQLRWGTNGASYGRPGRSDRVALIAGSAASGSVRPPVEWHTVNWQCRRYVGDAVPQNGGQAQNLRPAERLGPDPFQLVAFQDAVTKPLLGSKRDATDVDIRHQDRIVKFPSGELPAAAPENTVYGAGSGGADPMRGFVDEIDVTDQAAEEVLVDEAFTADALSFRVNRFGAMRPQGQFFDGSDRTTQFPKDGGLLLVDDEILAYSSQQGGEFQVAKNGRGLLGSKERGHDRGGRVRFLTQRPVAILTSGVQTRDDKFPVQAIGTMPDRMGTALLARREYLHYTWVRVAGDAVSFEMPRLYPPGEDVDGTGSHGLFRGRYGTEPMGASAGEPLIWMPFRYWDRYVERSDDPEQAYFQLTTREAPVFFRTLYWQQETQDALVEVVCLLRADEHGSFRDDPKATFGLQQWNKPPAADRPYVLGIQATQLELRFAQLYKPGCLDLATWRAHGWKTAPRVKDVRLEYEGEGRVLAERVTTR
jgi:hypothetical protein